MQLFVNDLTVIDFSYCCPERGIVGESWIVDVLLEGDLNEMSMVLDFGVVKKQIKQIIDDAVDHKLVLPMQSQAIELLSSSHHDHHQYLNFDSARGSYYLQSPQQAFAQIPCQRITLETVTKYLQQLIMAQLPKNVLAFQLTLRPEQIASDYYHYTHGLKLHDGNCQRIAHGHRSKIQIFENGQRSTELEQYWCQRWQDIYLASEADRISKDNVELASNANLSPDHQYFAYQAPQGRFDIAVPAAVLEVVDCDSTVELLADFIVRQLKLLPEGTAKGAEESAEEASADSHANREIKVVAFEGVGKGAIAHD